MRAVSGMMLLLAVGLTVGCGGTNPPPVSESKSAPAEDPNKLPPQPQSQPDQPKQEPATANKVPPPSPASGWEMDPAKHALPNTPAAGKLAGMDFVPEAQVQGSFLRFRTLKEGQPDRQIELLLKEPGMGFEGLKKVVRPDAPDGPDIPLIVVSHPGAVGAEPRQFEKGYALTLELDKRDKGQISGKVYLSLPGDDKSYLSGTFSAEWVRTETELPGADDVPFIAGTLKVEGATGPDVRVGYVRIEPNDPNSLVLDLIGTMLKPGGFPARSEAYRPRVAVLIPATEAKEPARFEFTKLPPGRYLAFAAVKDGPLAWRWVAVAADAKLAADLSLDVGKVGGLEVTVPPGVTGPVTALPAAEDPAKPWPEALILTAGSVMGMEAAIKDNKATFARFGPGRYDIRCGDLTATIEVKVGETAKVELNKK